MSLPEGFYQLRNMLQPGPALSRESTRSCQPITPRA